MRCVGRRGGARGPIGIAGVAGGSAGVGVDNRVVSVKSERPEAGGQLFTGATHRDWLLDRVSGIAAEMPELI